jgi:multicomponent Na+:H+ antiporter subunit B
MTFRETLRGSALGESSTPIVSGPPKRIWGTDGRLDSHHAHEPLTRGDSSVTTTMTQAVARALLPISVMVGVAILVKGYSDTGDGFSAGVILSLGAVTQVACFGIGIVERIPLLRYAPFAAYLGIVLALGIAFGPLFFGEPLFTHWPPAGDSPIHFGTLEIITAVGFDICVCLLVFGFVVGTMTLLARTASVASIQQSQSIERHRAPGERYVRPDIRIMAPICSDGEPPRTRRNDDDVRPINGAGGRIEIDGEDMTMNNGLPGRVMGEPTIPPREAERP